MRSRTCSATASTPSPNSPPTTSPPSTTSSTASSPRPDSAPSPTRSAERRTLVSVDGARPPDDDCDEKRCSDDQIGDQNRSRHTDRRADRPRRHQQCARDARPREPVDGCIELSPGIALTYGLAPRRSRRRRHTRPPTRSATMSGIASACSTVPLTSMPRQDSGRFGLTTTPSVQPPNAGTRRSAAATRPYTNNASKQRWSSESSESTNSTPGARSHRRFPDGSVLTSSMDERANNAHEIARPVTRTCRFRLEGRGPLRRRVTSPLDDPTLRPRRRRCGSQRAPALGATAWAVTRPSRSTETVNAVCASLPVRDSSTWIARSPSAAGRLPCSQLRLSTSASIVSSRRRREPPEGRDLGPPCRWQIGRRADASSTIRQRWSGGSGWCALRRTVRSRVDNDKVDERALRPHPHAPTPVMQRSVGR